MAHLHISELVWKTKLQDWTQIHDCGTETRAGRIYRFYNQQWKVFFFFNDTENSVTVTWWCDTARPTSSTFKTGVRRYGSAKSPSGKFILFERGCTRLEGSAWFGDSLLWWKCFEWWIFHWIKVWSWYF